MHREYRQRAGPKGRRKGRQRGGELFSFFKKVAENPITQQLIKKGVQHLPGLYNAVPSRTKNDKIRNGLKSDTAKILLNKAVERYR